MEEVQYGRETVLKVNIRESLTSYMGYGKHVTIMGQL